MAPQKLNVIWSEAALTDLDQIADYIALDKESAAKRLVQKFFTATDRLARFPASGRIPPELHDLPYREIIVPPLRIIYRVDDSVVHVIYVFRGEQLLNASRLWHR